MELQKTTKSHPTRVVNPGTLFKLWQVRLEITLWALIAVVGCIPALFNASVAIHNINHSDEASNNTAGSVGTTKAACGWVVTTAIVTIVMMSFCILIQLVHSTILTERILGMVCIIEVILMMSFILAGGLATRYHEVHWSDSVVVPLVFTIAFSILTAIFLFLSILWTTVYIVKGWHRTTIDYIMQ